MKKYLNNLFQASVLAVLVPLILGIVILTLAMVGLFLVLLAILMPLILLGAGLTGQDVNTFVKTK